MIRIIVVTIIFTLGGCIPIYLPIIEPEPWKEDELGEIIVGQSSRQEVLELFGSNYIERDDGSIWILGEKRHVGHLTVIFLTGIAADYLDDYQFIVVEFDRDVVKGIEIVEDLGGIVNRLAGCSSTGLCLRRGWHHAEKGLYTGDVVLISTIGSDDKAAKTFASISEKCALYVYQDYAVGRVGVASSRNILIDDSTYIYVLLEPGSHTVTALHGYDRKGKQIVKYEITCKADEIVFLEIYDKSFNWGLNPTVKRVDIDTARKALSKRSLILPP